jgi:REP element-mobilizing transposase RayT
VSLGCTTVERQAEFAIGTSESRFIQLAAKTLFRSEGALAGSHGWSEVEPVVAGCETNLIRPGGAADYSGHMAGTFSNLKFHLVFSTKHREPWLTDDIRPRVFDYMGGIVRGEKGVLLEIGGVSDHVHILFGWRTDEAISTLVRNLKANSSKWIHESFPNLRQFAWQEGYSIFAVSQSQVE